MLSSRGPGDRCNERIISESFSTNYKQSRRGDGRDRDLISRTVDYSGIKFDARLNQTGESSPRRDKPRKKYGRKRDLPTAVALFLTSSSSACLPPSFLALLKIFRAPDEVRGAKRRNLLKSLARPREPRPLIFDCSASLPPPLPSLSAGLGSLSLKVNLLKSSSSGLVLRSQT